MECKEEEEEARLVSFGAFSGKITRSNPGEGVGRGGQGVVAMVEAEEAKEDGWKNNVIGGSKRE